MASIQKRPNGSWRARYKDPSGKERARHFDRKSDAQRWLDEMTTGLVTGAYVDPRAGRVLLRDYAELRWLTAQVHLRPNTQDLYRMHLKNHVLPAFGGRPLGSLRRPDMKAFVAHLATKLAPATVHTVYGVLRSILQSAVDDELIPANPCSRVPLPRIDPRVVEPLPSDSVLTLMQSITPRYSIAVLLGAAAGLREGEALGLLIGRIDFLRRRIHVEQQLTGNGTAPQLSPLKTRASRRIVPVDDVVLEAVAEHIRRFPPSTEGFLITNRLRKPVRRSSFGNRWKLAVRTADLPPNTRFHDLRHFYASTLIAANLHPKTIQARLGHASIVETLDTYGHLFPMAEEEGRGVLDRALRPAPVQDHADYSRT
ncbi:MAG TPA: site-specific integrase [Mycobacteriales bacterium]|jgi:integrase|nr:site-specific integrase [Mycobacteriales bacterium]